MRVVRAAVCVAISMVLWTASANAVERFGSELNHSIRPTGGSSPTKCYSAQKCTFVMIKAYGRGDDAAPRDGIVDRIRMIACEAGTLKLQLVRIHKGDYTARAVIDGPTIKYKGDKERCADFRYDIESIKLASPLVVEKGDRLAVTVTRISTLYDDSGTYTSWMFAPPLIVSQGFKQAKFLTYHYLLIEAEYR